MQFYIVADTIREVDVQPTSFSLTVILGVCTVGLLAPALQTARSGRRRPPCYNNVRQQIIAMHNYHDTYGHLPPAYVADEKGNPLHSWRILVLPFLDDSGLYEKYNFDEPWDGPNNRKLVDQLGTNSPFFCPHQPGLGSRTTYKLVTGIGTAFEADRLIKFSDITSGTSSTIAIVEDTTNPVNWMKPEDLSISQALDLLDLGKNPESMRHVKETKFERKIWYGSPCGFFDGSARYLGPNKYPKTMQEWFLKDGAGRGYEFPDKFTSEPRVGRSVVVGYGYLMVAINIFLAVLPYFWEAKWRA